jgi:hypothetical protein
VPIIPAKNTVMQASPALNARCRSTLVSISIGRPRRP